MAEEQYKELARQFVNQYVNISKTDPQQLAPLYVEPAMLSVEGKQFNGRAEICTKLKEMFSGVNFVITTVDALPTPDNSLVVTAVGQLKDNSQQNPLGFSQVFVLKCIGDSWMICDHIFHLLVHDF